MCPQVAAWDAGTLLVCSQYKRAGLRIACVQPNPQYPFLGEQAQGAQRRFGVTSISVLAIKG